MARAYIHYGACKYDPEKFKPIKNQIMWVKPKGGLWASPKDAVFGWEEWCEASEFRERIENISFEFSLAPHAKILELNSAQDLTDLPKVDIIDELRETFRSVVHLDFEKLVSSGVDAIQVNIRGEAVDEFGKSLYYVLYGWDCDSILVMNKDVIVCENFTQF